MKNKNGFTIVELVIVIAVIGILAAVLVPVLSNVINKAEESKDIQLANNMNTAIAIENADGSIETLTDALYALALNGINSIETTQEGCQFMWDPNSQKVLYVDENYNVLNYEGYDSNDHNNWLSMIFNEEALSNNSSTYENIFN